MVVNQNCSNPTQPTTGGGLNGLAHHNKRKERKFEKQNFLFQNKKKKKTKRKNQKNFKQSQVLMNDYTVSHKQKVH